MFSWFLSIALLITAIKTGEYAIFIASGLFAIAGQLYLASTNLRKKD